MFFLGLTYFLIITILYIPTTNILKPINLRSMDTNLLELIYKTYYNFILILIYKKLSLSWKTIFYTYFSLTFLKRILWIFFTGIPYISYLLFQTIIKTQPTSIEDFILANFKPLPRTVTIIYYNKQWIIV